MPVTQIRRRRPDRGLCRFGKLLLVAGIVAAGGSRLPAASTTSPAEREIPSGEQVIALLEQMRTMAPSLPSGRGSAIVHLAEWPWGGERQEEISFVEFRFSGQKRRCDFFDTTDGSKGDRRSCYTLTDRFVRFRQGGRGYVSIDPLGSVGLKHRLGQDFHPVTFYEVHGYGVWDWIDGFVRALREGRATCSMTVDSNDVIRATYRRKLDDPQKQLTVQFAVDASDGFHLLQWEASQKNVNGIGSSDLWRQELKWKRYDGAWYVQEASFESRFAAAASKPEAKLGESGSHTKVKILEFTPNAEVKDGEFDIGSLGIPAGALVADEISGLTYRYGGRPVSAKGLEEALEGSALAQQYAAGGSSEPPAENAGTTTRPAGASPAEAPQRPSSQLAAGRSNWGWYATACIGAAALMGVICGIVWLRSGRAKCEAKG